MALMADSPNQMIRSIQDARFQIRQDWINRFSIGKAGRLDLQQTRREARIPSIPHNKDHALLLECLLSLLGRNGIR